MEQLSRIAQGLLIGNGEVWNFLDYAVNRNCGSLISYTQKNNFLKANLFNNFNGGNRRRYLTGIDIDDTGNYAPGKFGEYLTKTNVNANGGMIGELYFVNDNSNSELKFITKEKFISFNKDIRNLSLNLNLIDYDKRFDEKAISPESYLSDIGDFDVLPEAKNVYNFQDKKGEEYNVVYNDRQGTNRTLNEVGKAARIFNENTKRSIKSALKTDSGIDEETKYKGVEITSKFPVYKGPIGDKIKERTKSLKSKLSIDEVANAIRKEKFDDNFLPLNNLIKQNNFILNTFKSTEPYLGSFHESYYGKSIEDVLRFSFNIENDIFTNGVDTSKVNTLVIRTEEGLKEYYNDLRENYTYAFAGIKYPWGGPWSLRKSYGVDLTQIGREFYEGNDNKNPVNTAISPDFNGGQHRGVINNTVTYSYFQEPDGDNISPNLNTQGGLYNWNSVSLSDFNNTSRLLQKTNELFKQSKINTLINRFHTKATDADSELISSYDGNFGLSRGRNLIKKEYEGRQIGDGETGYDNPYCRVWTAHHQYSKLKDRIRPFVSEDGYALSISQVQEKYGNLRPNSGALKLDSETVLRPDGYLNITATYDESGTYRNYKKYMFSIENLAWRDSPDNAFSDEQRGSYGGRIMWFPPYNLKFSENVNVNWNANSFIGRGEEIYTYTNTMRTGTLDFTLLIDHPSVLNKFRGTGSDVENKVEMERDILRYFAGCGMLSEGIKNKQVQEEGNINEEPSIEPSPTTRTKKIAYIVFFPNNFSGVDSLNEPLTILSYLYNYSEGGTFVKVDKSYERQVLSEKNKKSKGFSPSNIESIIRQYFFEGDEDIEIKYAEDLYDIANEITGNKIFSISSETCRIKNIEIKGFASSHGYYESNIELCKRRSKILKRIIQSQSAELTGTDLLFTESPGQIIKVSKIGEEDVNSMDAKMARAAYAIFEIEWKEENVAKGDSLTSGATVSGANLDGNNDGSQEETDTPMYSTTTVVEEDKYTYDNEYLYFSGLRSDSLEYKSIVDKVRYFEPGFHSITPEGFNSRLTFLHQCTRQGPTNAVSNGNVSSSSNDYQKFAGNLAFGRAPYCILRIGDFFNTKICIDSLSINYDNNGIQWDLNPEGVGVQPMFANISITFKFIGGQDISGPVERLQNAVTANYYANASVYSRHADNNVSYYDVIRNESI